MAATDIRYTVRATLVAAIAAQLTGTQVELGWPGDQLALESVWLGESDGTCQIPVMKAGYKTMDDEFTVPIELQAGAVGQTLTAAEQRLQVMTAVVETVLLTDPSLGSLNGVIAAVITRKRGPVTVRTKQGAVSFGRIEVSVHAREQ